MQIAVCDDEKVYLDCLSRKIEVCFKEFDIEISNEDAEKIITVGDAVEQIKNATN